MANSATSSGSQKSVTLFLVVAPQGMSVCENQLGALCRLDEVFSASASELKGVEIVGGVVVDCGPDLVGSDLAEPGRKWLFVS